jgi:hypothetical protein
VSKLESHQIRQHIDNLHLSLMHIQNHLIKKWQKATPSRSNIAAQNISDDLFVDSKAEHTRSGAGRRRLLRLDENKF